MDFSQIKLSKSEWESIEIPILEKEKKILKMIMDGFQDVNIRDNSNTSLLQLLKINGSTEIHHHLFNEYFSKECEWMNGSGKKMKNEHPVYNILREWRKKHFPRDVVKKMKKADLIRMKNISSNVSSQKENIFEFLLLDFCEKIISSFVQNKEETAFYLYTLIQIKKTKISTLNPIVLEIVDFIISLVIDKINVCDVFYNSTQYIENNPHLLKCEDLSLFEHQKQLFSIFKQNDRTIPRLVLYTAPTGTGKTLSPIGFLNNYKIIFVCVARHVGLSLAKSCISMGKKIAFAFGCETASDIRLHYLSASTYSINKKSGGIYKVDNGDGRNVEIIITDVKSYLISMHYMLAFNMEENIITYWDEPTITMDCDEHELHSIIHQNWKENKISKMVLSCATLPKEEEITDVLEDFRNRFENAEINTIHSSDYKKSISIVNEIGKCSLPHLLFEKYEDLMNCCRNCENNQTLLRYMDLNEIVLFVRHLHENHYIEEKHSISNYFHSIDSITMNSVKTYYLHILTKIKKENWDAIYSHVISHLKKKFENSSDTGVLLTTKDAHTLTSGPSIYMTDDIEKIANIFTTTSNVPNEIFDEIIKKINENENIQKKIISLEKAIEDNLSTGKNYDDKTIDRKMAEMKETKQIEFLRSNLKMIHLDSKYIPNTTRHQQVWTGKVTTNAYVPSIHEPVIKEIMGLNIDNQWKLLLLLGIGVFTNHSCIEYIEIMKRLAQEQKLYLIIAQTDYIYGTNYQFCHGFIGKDLKNATPQKIIQAIGRIGRNNIQHNYSVRFRDNEMIKKLFNPSEEENKEAIIMKRLFSS